MNSRNEKQTFKEFIDKEYDKLICYARKNYHDYYMESDAEDIVQDIALSIYDKINLNQPIDNLAAYFYRSIKNRIADLFKKKKREMLYDDYLDENKRSVLLQTQLSEEFHEEVFWEREKNLERVFLALEKLKPSFQYILIETEVNRRSFKDLSDELNEPIGTLLSRKNRAIHQLRKLLSQ